MRVHSQGVWAGVSWRGVLPEQVIAAGEVWAKGVARRRVGSLKEDMPIRMHTITQISDLHFGRVDPTIADALLADLHAKPPSLLVVSGDLTQRARPPQFRAAMAFLHQCPTPWLMVPGNHDVPAVNLFSRVFTPMANYRLHAQEDLAPVYHDGFMTVVGINTAHGLTQKGGRIGPLQLAQTKEHFDRYAGAGPQMRIVVAHHPLLPSPNQKRRDLVRGAGKALAAFEQMGVDMILSGHFHMTFCGDVRTHHTGVSRSILAVNCGTSTSTRVRHGEPNAYNRIEMDLQRVRISHRAWTGSRFEESAEAIYTRQAIDGGAAEPREQVRVEQLSRR